MVNRPAGGDHSQPTGESAVVIASEAPELFEIVLYQRQKDVLKDVLKDVVDEMLRWAVVMGARGRLDPMID
jgi:hypothetical protein